MEGTGRKNISNFSVSPVLKTTLPINELYSLALKFYKEKCGNAIHISYQDNLKLIAYAKQVANGSFDIFKAPTLGVLDVIGKDRRAGWQELGNMSKTQAMEGFVILLNKLVPSFHLFVEAVKRNNEQNCTTNTNSEIQLHENIQLSPAEENANSMDMKRRLLQDLLNQQTYRQFKMYAEKQFPRNPEQQGVVIRQLQNEHYHQYMQRIRSETRANDTKSEEKDDTKEEMLNKNIVAIQNECCDDICDLPLVDEICTQNIALAKMWTRSNIKQFKTEVSSGSGDGVITLEHGETITVRVPTHEAGKCIFWEFATDDYDIGFGVYFEWCRPTTNEVTIHVSDSDEDVCDDMDDDTDCWDSSNLDSATTVVTPENQISMIIPVYRRECFKEVYVGSHKYPEQGMYLLKFDNSYSIWRSKTLYYKVYYECSL